MMKEEIILLACVVVRFEWLKCKKRGND